MLVQPVSAGSCGRTWWWDLFPLSASPQDKRQRYSMMHSQESGSSVFFHSQEEGAGLESWNHSRDSEGSCPTERSPDHLGVGRDLEGESDTDTGQSFLCTCGGVMPLSL